MAGIDDFVFDDRSLIKDERDARTKDPNRNQILPFKKGEDGTLDWTLPQWAMEMINAVTLPRDTLRGYKPTTEDTLDFAGAVAGGGMSSSLLGGQAKDPNTLGMFLGKQAKGADTRELARAMSWDDQGVDPEEIWKNTGWFKGLDGNWKWEIPDNNLSLPQSDMLEKGFKSRNSKFINPFNKGGDFTTDFEPTSEAIKHPDLFEQYPFPENGVVSAHAAAPIDVPYSKKRGLSGTPSASIESVFPTTQLGLIKDDGLRSLYAGGYQGGNVQEIIAKGDTLDRIRWVVAHELQHAVQEREGFEPGSNARVTDDIVSFVSKSLPSPALKYLGTKQLSEALKDEIISTKQIIENAGSGSPKGWSLYDGDNIEYNDLEVEDAKELLSLLENDYKSIQALLPEQEKEISSILPEVKKIASMIDRSSFDNYQRNAGEAEARLTQTRLDRDPELNRMTYPLKDLDVPVEETWTYKELENMEKKFRDWEQDQYIRYLDSVVNKEAEKGYEEGLNELIGNDEPRKYAKGGMVIDPVSGNEVPPGARPEEVRDDIDIKASEGEYIIPANVVRFLGVDKLEKMVTKAQEALQALDDTGRIGGDPKEDLEELPFDISTLEAVDDDGVQEFAEGGLVEDQGGAAAIPGVQTKQYKDANGNVMFIPVINGVPLFQPPPNYSEDNPNAVTNKAPNPMSNVSTGTVNVDNDPSPNERTQGRSPLAGSPTEWSVDNFLDYTKQKNDIGSKAIKGMIGMIPGGRLALKARDKFLDPQVAQLFDTMIESGIDPVGNTVSPEQRAQLIESRNQLKKQMSDNSGLNLNPIERLTDAFSAFARFTTPDALKPQGGGSTGAPASSLNPEATRMVSGVSNNRSDNQYSGGNVSVGEDLGKQNNGPTSGSMRSGGLYSGGGLVSRRQKNNK